MDFPTKAGLTATLSDSSTKLLKYLGSRTKRTDAQARRQPPRTWNFPYSAVNLAKNERNATFIK